MPTYRYHCNHCQGGFEQWQSIHDAALTTHDGCGGRIVRVITAVRTYGVGDRGAQTRYSDSMDRQLDLDRPAYRRLRHEGHQPRAVMGAHKLEALATDDWSIKTGGLVSVPDDRKAEVNEMMAEAASTDWSAVEQVHTNRSL